jgi:hypothetical protein
LVAAVESGGANGATWTKLDDIPGGYRAWHSMTTLADGVHVLVAGGCIPSGPLSDAAVLDASAGHWRAAASMNHPRCGHGATLLSDGRVLVTGAQESNFAITADAEIYDPQSDTWSEIAPMHVARNRHGAALKPMPFG